MDNFEDKSAIRELVDAWIIYSDAGLWDDFLELWDEDGFMTATWFEATGPEFTKARREGFDRGVSIIHSHHGHTSRINNDRAIAHTKMTISQRAEVHGVLVDVNATGRFVDFLRKRNGAWRFVRKQGIYEKDRIDPVCSDDRLQLDQDLLNRFPKGYRHLAYLQTEIGYKVRTTGLPETTGVAVERLYRQASDWLEGADNPGRLED
ncbi:MAG: nuclear transport factor 2 family protein [Gammaproteobacteria bacterium]|nr:nuclear transport factor 2 family protein [Gammaproteobacteria bacterium]